MGNVEFLNHSIIAHRGIYNNITIMENTLESIMYAVKNNLIVEFDVRLTKDNKIIVFHDEEGGRLLKLKDKINSLTKEELDYLCSFSIPTIDVVLDNINDRVPIIIEVKDDNKIIRNELIKVLSKYKGRFAIQSFIYDAVTFYKKKGFITGLLVSDSKNKNFLNRNLNIDFLSIKYNILDKIQVKLLKEKYYIIGWTIDNRSDAEEYIKIYNNLIIDNIEEVFR